MEEPKYSLADQWSNYHKSFFPFWAQSGLLSQLFGFLLAVYFDLSLLSDCMVFFIMKGFIHSLLGYPPVILYKKKKWDMSVETIGYNLGRYITLTLTMIMVVPNLTLTLTIARSDEWSDEWQRPDMFVACLKQTNENWNSNQLLVIFSFPWINFSN